VHTFNTYLLYRIVKIFLCHAEEVDQSNESVRRRSYTYILIIHLQNMKKLSQVLVLHPILTYAVAQLVDALRYELEGSISGGVTEFFSDLILPVALCPWDRLSI
jgi:hypothetical protein